MLERRPIAAGQPLLDATDWRTVVRDGLLMAGLGQIAYVAGGPGIAFPALTGAQISYALRCRAPGSEPSPRFLPCIGGAAALQLLRLSLAPASTLLGIASAPLAIGAFVFGLVAPLWFGRPGADEIVLVPATSKEAVA